MQGHDVAAPENMLGYIKTLLCRSHIKSELNQCGRAVKAWVEKRAEEDDAYENGGEPEKEGGVVVKSGRCGLS